jgi:hypothetical protein
MHRAWHRHDIDEETITRSQERLAEMKLYEYSHRGEAANRVGAIGEIVFERWLEHHGVRFEWLADTHYDYRVAGSTVEVKTKDRTVPPRWNYEASVPEYNLEHQQADWYAFISLVRTASGRDIRDYQVAYIAGISRSEEYHQIAVRRDAGELDSSNGTRFWTACWNVRHDALGEPAAALAAWAKAASE